MKYLRNKLKPLSIRMSIISPRVRVLLLFFVVLPAMAISGAGVINKLILAPYLSDQAKASGTSTATPSGKLYNFYLLQAGVFSSESNAKAMAAQIKATGFKSCSIKDGEVYRVVAGGASEKSTLQQYSTSLQQSGYITLCKIFEINEEVLAGSPVGTKEYISAAGDLINAMLEYSSLTQKIDSAKIKTLEDHASSVRKQFDSIKDGAGLRTQEFNISIQEGLKEYLEQGNSLDKCTEIVWECIVSYGRMIEEVKN